MTHPTADTLVSYPTGATSGTGTLSTPHGRISRRMPELSAGATSSRRWSMR
jgi:hypothetical protein